MEILYRLSIIYSLLLSYGLYWFTICTTLHVLQYLYTSHLHVCWYKIVSLHPKYCFQGKAAKGCYRVVIIVGNKFLLMSIVPLDEAIKVRAIIKVIKTFL